MSNNRANAFEQFIRDLETILFNNTSTDVYRQSPKFFTVLKWLKFGVSYNSKFIIQIGLSKFTNIIRVLDVESAHGVARGDSALARECTKLFYKYGELFHLTGNEKALSDVVKKTGKLFDDD